MDHFNVTIAFIAIIVGIITYSAYNMLGFGPNQFPVNGKVKLTHPTGGISIDAANICMFDRQS